MRKSKTKTSRTNEDSEFILGMARGVWADYWANLAAKSGESLMGIDLYRAAPPTPKWASRWAEDLADKIVLMNTDRRGRISAKSGLEGLYEEALASGYAHDRKQFGVHLAAQAVGIGIRWTDDLRGLPQFEIFVPKDEFYPR